MLVQSLIDGGSVQLNIRVRFFQRRDTFRRCNQHQDFNAAAACFFQQVDGSDNGTAGCQHRVNDQRHTLINVRNQLLEVRNRLQRLFITVHTDHADTRARNVFQNAFHHAQARTQDWHNGDFFTFDLVNFNRAVPAFDGHLFGFQTGGCFISQQAANFRGEFTKAFSADVVFTHQSQLVFDEWVFDFHDLHTLLLSSDEWQPQKKSPDYTAFRLWRNTAYA